VQTTARSVNASPSLLERVGDAVRILQVILHFPPAYSYGGPLGVTYHASKELVKRGHEVTVFTTDVYDAKSRLKFQENPMIMDGIKVYHFRNLSNRLAHQNLAIAPSMAFALRKHIGSFDLVHLHEYFHFQAALVHHYATKKSVPYILQAHGSFPIIKKQNSERMLLSKNQLKKIFNIVFGHSIVNDASKIIATSRIESDQFQEAFADFPLDRVVHLPNYVDLKSYEDLPERGHFRRKYNIDERVKIVLFLSRIHERKGADLLVAAFGKAKQTMDFPAVLVIVGPDEGHVRTLKSLARKLAVENHVIFPGYIYAPEKLETFVDADVFVLPSKDHYESFGNVVLEALACGTPVIVTDNCGVSEWIGTDVGCIIEFDEEQLCDALHAVLRNERLSKILGNRGKKLIREQFGWDKGVLRLEELYKTVVNENAAENTTSTPAFYR
jgi:glycosyltransferase involved in cell wall biosynthesis